MRHSIPLLLGTLAAACVTESQRARPSQPGPAAAPDRSQETLREIERQRRWMADALAARPPADELDALREGDADAVSDTRKRFRRLLNPRAGFAREKPKLLVEEILDVPQIHWKGQGTCQLHGGSEPG